MGGGGISGDRGGQGVGPSLPIHLFGNVASKTRRTCEPQRGGAPYCWRILETYLSNGKKKYICNIHAVQQDTQCVSVSKSHSSRMLALHVSDPTGPSSGAFCTSCIRRLWYVVIRVLLDTSSRYKVVGRTVFVFHVVFL